VTEIYRGVKEMGNLLRKVRLDIAVNEDFVEPTIKAIIKGARTGEIGNGKIFVLDLVSACVSVPKSEAARRSDRPSAGPWNSWPTQLSLPVFMEDMPQCGCALGSY